MSFGKLLAVFVLASLAIGQNQDNSNENGGLTLDNTVVQKGSAFDGSGAIGADEKTQAKSLTSTNNFINFCKGQALTNGLQITTGSCNGIPMGQIPSKDRMVSSVIINPASGQTISSGKDFNITVRVSNLAAGSFTNAASTYYSAPQQLQNGQIVGHTHVTVQDLGGTLNPQTPPDPKQFAFFKGINDAGNGRGTLSAIVSGGLPPGSYRVCTMTAASNHQPVLMPVAQRGSPDDCSKFTVSGNDGDINPAASNGADGQAAAVTAADAVAAGPGAIAGGKKGGNAGIQGGQGANEADGGFDGVSGGQVPASQFSGAGAGAGFAGGFSRGRAAVGNKRIAISSIANVYAVVSTHAQDGTNNASKSQGNGEGQGQR